MIDYKGIADELLLNAERYVREWLPGGVKQGNEYLPLNPKRDDKKPGSFSINVKTGAWLEGATGDKGGDLLSLYAYINNMSQGEAAKALSESNSISSISGRARNQAKGRKVDDGFTLCLPVPDDAPEPFNATSIAGGWHKPSAKYSYTDANGAVMRLIYRFEGNGLPKKEFRPLTCWRDKNGVLGWKYKDIPENRPLYNLDELARRPFEPVLVVEGEKCVEAVKKTLLKYVVTTWHGGVNGINKTNINPLHGRKLVLWPDNDDVGKNTMRRIADKYGGRVLSIPPDKPQGWDCADAAAEGWDVAKFEEFISAVGVENAVPGLSEVAPMGIFPHRTEKGKIISTIENLRALMKYYKLEIWYNEISKSIGSAIDGVYDASNNINGFYAQVISVSNLNGLPKSDVVSFLDYEAKNNHKNPVVEWISSKPWDGISRVNEICAAVHCDDTITEEFKETMISKWLVSAYAMVSRKDGDNTRTRGVLVFEGEESIGKTTFFKHLCGADWGGDIGWFGEGMVLNPEKQDSILNINKVWIGELGEVESSTWRASPAIKAYLTNSAYILRLPYAKAAETIWSRTVYVGTVNGKDILNEATGDTRFWCISVLSLDDISGIDMQQMWAEVKYYKDKGVVWWLTREEEEQLKINNIEYQVASPVVELLASQLDWETNQHISMWPKKTCTVILKECGMQNPTQSDARRAGIYMRKRLGIKKAPSVSTGGARFYPCPPFRQT
jgi:hypothetical protein